MAFRLQVRGCMLAALVLTGCATPPPQTEPTTATDASSATTTSAAWPAMVQVDVERVLPVFTDTRDSEALVASRFIASVNEDRLRYRASWSVEPGEALSGEQFDAGTRLGGQRLGQNVSLRLPELAGSPLSLGVSSELRNDLSVSGYQQLQHEEASLDWAPGPASVQVQWAGTATPFSPGTALACDVRSTLRLTTHTGLDHSEGMTFSGSACTVAADGTPYAGIDARTWGLGYAWERADRTTEALLSVIDPAGMVLDTWRSVSPGYEFDVSHRRDFGALSAAAGVSLREAPAWEYLAAVGGVDAWPGDNVDGGWTTHTSLTWNLRSADLSANWASGVNRLWFTPETNGRSDRFALTLDLSRWAGVLAPSASLAMNWNWSQLWLPNRQLTDDNAVHLDMALNF